MIATLDHELRCTITKTRCASLKGFVDFEVGEELGRKLLAWLNSGEAAAPAERTEPKNGHAEPKRSSNAGAAWVQWWRKTLGDDLAADVFGVSVDALDDYQPPADKAQRAALVETLERTRRDLEPQAEVEG